MEASPGARTQSVRRTAAAPRNTLQPRLIVAGGESPCEARGGVKNDVFILASLLCAAPDSSKTRIGRCWPQGGFNPVYKCIRASEEKGRAGQERFWESDQ